MSVLCKSPGTTRELMAIFHINKSPPVLVEQFHLGEVLRTTFGVSWEFSVPAWETLSEFPFISNEISHLSHIVSHAICSVFHWPVFPSNSTGTKSVTLWRSWKVTVLPGVLQVTLAVAVAVPPLGHLFKARRLRCPSVMWLMQTSKPWCYSNCHFCHCICRVSSPLSQRALDGCNCRTANKKYKEKKEKNLCISRHRDCFLLLCWK